MFGWIIGVYLFLKGFGYPNSWAATQAQIDYSQGFTKRGLFGAVITRALHLENYVHFAVISTVLLLSLFLSLFAFAKWSRMAARLSCPLLPAVIAGSFVVSYIARLCGYLDIPLALATVCLLFVSSAKLRFFLALPVVAACLFMHEAYLLTFFPLCVASFIFQDEGLPASQRGLHALGRTSALTAFAVILTVAISLHPSLQPSAILRLQTAVSSRVDFRVFPMVFPVLGRSGMANVQLMRQIIYTDFWQMRFWQANLAFMPVLCLFAAFCLILI